MDQARPPLHKDESFTITVRFTLPMIKLDETIIKCIQKTPHLVEGQFCARPKVILSIIGQSTTGPPHDSSCLGSWSEISLGPYRGEFTDSTRQDVIVFYICESTKWARGFGSRTYPDRKLVVGTVCGIPSTSSAQVSHSAAELAFSCAERYAINITATLGQCCFEGLFPGHLGYGTAFAFVFRWLPPSTWEASKNSHVFYTPQVTRKHGHCKIAAAVRNLGHGRRKKPTSAALYASKRSCEDSFWACGTYLQRRERLLTTKWNLFSLHTHWGSYYGIFFCRTNQPR